MKDLVYNFPTKNKEGFTNSEIDELLSKFDNLNVSKFQDALRGVTCMVIDNEIVIYHCDILTALYCGLENRDMYSYEMD